MFRKDVHRGEQIADTTLFKQMELCWTGLVDDVLDFQCTQSRALAHSEHCRDRVLDSAGGNSE